MATIINSDIELNQIITGAIKGDPEALDRLRFGEWFMRLQDGIAARMAYKFGVDVDEIRDAIFDKLSKKIQDVKNPNNSPLTKCLSAWCERVANSFCLNKLRRHRVEKKYLERLAARESMKGTRKSTEGGSTPLQSGDENSPDEVLIEKEAAESRERIIADVYFEVKKRLDNSSPNDIRVVICWGAGMMNLKQISEVTGIPISTVHRHLTAWQKPLVQTVILQQIVHDDPKHRRIGALIRIAVNELYSGRMIFLHRRPKTSR